MSSTTPEDRDLLGAGSYKADNRLGSKSVLGTVEKSSAGNIVLHVGRLNTPEPGWQQTEHLVLEPKEARVLVAQLLTLLSAPSASQLLNAAIKRAAQFYFAMKTSTDPHNWEQRTQAATWVVEDMLIASGKAGEQAHDEAVSLIACAVALLPDHR